MAQTIIDLLKKCAEANNADKYRRGNLVHLPSEGSLVVTGDLHGHRRNFEKIIDYADLEHNTDRHLIFQEVIHGGDEDEFGGDLSYKVLFDLFRYKLSFPDRVHVIMGNHDTAFINNSEVMKDGKEMNRVMRQAMDREFGEYADEIKLATRQLLFSQPLAVHTENRIWMSHSLPADRLMDKFDHGIFDRYLKINDTVRPGSAYILTWGRKHSQELLDKMAAMLKADFFVLGHQPQDQGWCQAGSNLVILASNHNHGRLLSIDLSKTYTMDKLIESLVPLASIS